MKQFDVLIIGAGAVGNAIAREISKKNTVTVGVLEKEPDTAFGISGRNSGVLHAGFNNKPGSFMAKLVMQALLPPRPSPSEKPANAEMFFQPVSRWPFIRIWKDDRASR